jgi:hypothetical protein
MRARNGLNGINIIFGVPSIATVCFLTVLLLFHTHYIFRPLWTIFLVEFVLVLSQNSDTITTNITLYNASAMLHIYLGNKVMRQQTSYTQNYWVDVSSFYSPPPQT